MSFSSIITVSQGRKNNRHEPALRQWSYWQGWDNEVNPFKRYKIDNNIRSIDPGVFENLRSMEHCELNDGLLSINGGAFAGCDGLEEIIIPDSVGYIGAESFYDCFSLQ